MPKCDFNKVALQLMEITIQHGCSPVNLLHIFRTSFTKITSGWRLLLLHNNNFFFLTRYFGDLSLIHKRSNSLFIYFFTDCQFFQITLS